MQTGCLLLWVSQMLPRYSYRYGCRCRYRYRCTYRYRYRYRVKLTLAQALGSSGRTQRARDGDHDTSQGAWAAGLSAAGTAATLAACEERKASSSVHARGACRHLHAGARALAAHAGRASRLRGTSCPGAKLRSRLERPRDDPLEEYYIFYVVIPPEVEREQSKT